jgi:hypothetical protein
MDSRKGWAVKYRSTPPAANSAAIAAGRRQPRCRNAQLLDSVRRVAEQQPQVGEVEPDEHQRVGPAEAAPREDHAEVEQRRHQPDDLDRVLRGEPNRGEPPRGGAAAGHGGDEIDHGPPQAEEQADGAGEVGDREVRARRVAARFPSDHGLDGELGQGLQPGEDREREPLGNEELRGFRAPGHEERRGEDAGKRPERGQRRGSRRGQRRE